MKVHNLKRRFITLIEMMIVMFLIAMITGVIAYNYTGSLEEGKAFKTKNGIEKIHTILDLYLATNPGASISNWKEIVAESPLVKNSRELVVDGWGAEYQVEEGENNSIVINSAKYNEYLRKGTGSMFKKESK